LDTDEPHTFIKYSFAWVGLFFDRCAQNKDELTTQSVGLLMDWSSFDGCGWVIELKNSDHTILKPNNLLQFNITLTDSMLVKFVMKWMPIKAPVAWQVPWSICLRYAQLTNRAFYFKILQLGD
jgi:hypothetical protein